MRYPNSGKSSKRISTFSATVPLLAILSPNVVQITHCPTHEQLETSQPAGLCASIPGHDTNMKPHKLGACQNSL